MDELLLKLKGNFTARYFLRKPKTKTRELIVLLHGYSQQGDSFYELVKEALPADAAVLSPNGPFPVPVQAGDRWQMGFSWYFYEFSRDEYYVDMELAARYVPALVAKLGLSPLPKRIVGFSQGGYLAPFAARHLTRVKQVVGVNAQFLDEEMTFPVKWRMDAINGAQDRIVSPRNAARSMEKLKKRGVPGEHVLVPAAGHGIKEATRAALREVLLY